MRDLKRGYREEFERLKAVRSEADYTARLLEQCTQTLALDFSAWYEKTYGRPIAEAAAAAAFPGGKTATAAAGAAAGAEYAEGAGDAEDAESPQLQRLMSAGTAGERDEAAFLTAARVARKIAAGAPRIQRKGAKGTF